jgi:hypothetical protein
LPFDLAAAALPVDFAAVVLPADFAAGFVAATGLAAAAFFVPVALVAPLFPAAAFVLRVFFSAGAAVAFEALFAADDSVDLDLAIVVPPK